MRCAGDGAERKAHSQRHQRAAPLTARVPVKLESRKWAASAAVGAGNLAPDAY